MFKILKGNTPSYLRTFFSIRNTEYNLTNNQFKLNLPKPRTFLTMRLYCGIVIPEETRSCLVTKTWLNYKIPSSLVCLGKYVLASKDRSGSHLRGGVTILCRDD